MTRVRINGGKPTTIRRAIKRDRRHARKSNERQTSERHLANLRLQAFNYNAKQSRRWLRARILSVNRGSVTEEVAVQLAKHFQKTEHQLLHPRITDTVLLPNARWVLSQLESEREAAREEQGHPERVQDWWAEAPMIGKKKRKRMMMGEEQGATAAQSVGAEGLRDEDGALGRGEEEMDVEEGGVLLDEEEEFEGFESPVMMSPGGL